MLVKRAIFLRLAGKRSSGSWDTQAWLISKDDAHLEGTTLVANTDDARKLIDALGTKPKLVNGDVFEAKDRPNAPEGKKLKQRRNGKDCSYERHYGFQYRPRAYINKMIKPVMIIPSDRNPASLPGSSTPQ